MRTKRTASIKSNTMERLTDKLDIFYQFRFKKTTIKGKLVTIYMILQSRLLHKHHVLTVPKLEVKYHILSM